MEKISVRRNVLTGLCNIFWIVALVVFLTEKENLDTLQKKNIFSGVVIAILSAVCGIIPFLGWACSIVLLVFAILQIVNMFKGNYEYKAPLISAVCGWFIKG